MPPEAVPDAVDGGPTEVDRRSRRRRAEEHSVVLQAMGIPHELVRDGWDFVILTRAEDAPRALEQLALYGRERDFLGRRTPPPARWSEGLAGAAGFALAISLVNALDWTRAFGRDWTEAGRLEGGRVQGGELWRAATALTLHADLGHLAANLVFGGFFAVLLCEGVGLAVGWAVLFGSGLLGNVANAWLQGPEHRAIGASTAVFGAIAAVAAIELVRHRTRGGFFLRWGAPIAGLFLLSWLGTGGDRTDVGRTDVGAHLCGFAAGALLGLGAERLDRGLAGRRKLRLVLAAAVPALLALAWVAALRAD